MKGTANLIGESSAGRKSIKSPHCLREASISDIARGQADIRLSDPTVGETPVGAFLPRGEVDTVARRDAAIVIERQNRVVKLARQQDVCSRHPINPIDHFEALRGSNDSRNHRIDGDSDYSQ